MTRPLILIPSFDPGPALLRRTVAAAVAAAPPGVPVWVVSDASTDGSDQAAAASGARVLRLPRHAGKGAAVLHGLRHAEGFTHALLMDADDQHPPGRIAPFLAASAARPEAMILGQPVFGPDAPWLRRAGRTLANLPANLLAPGIGDALFGFRVYPVAPLLAAFARTGRAGHMRGFGFDPEAAIRLHRAGIPAIRLPAPVRYHAPARGGVSHYRYGRDNLVLIGMFGRLLLERFRAPPR